MKSIPVELQLSNNCWQRIQTGTMRSLTFLMHHNEIICLSVDYDSDLEQLVWNEIEMNEWDDSYLLHLYYCREPATYLQGFPWNVREIRKWWGKVRVIRTVWVHSYHYSQNEKYSKKQIPAYVRSTHMLRLLLCLKNARIFWVSAGNAFHPVVLNNF